MRPGHKTRFKCRRVYLDHTEPAPRLPQPSWRSALIQKLSAACKPSSNQIRGPFSMHPLLFECRATFSESARSGLQQPSSNAGTLVLHNLPYDPQPARDLAIVLRRERAIKAWRNFASRFSSESLHHVLNAAAYFSLIHLHLISHFLLFQHSPAAPFVST